MAWMNRSKRERMLIGTSVIALSVFAATAPGIARAAGENTVQELVVTGQRAAIQSAQAIKMQSTQIVDSISAVDIGALPDRSVTEALQRVPGVTIGRTSDPRDADRLSVEGSGVQIRGLSWVRGELNGRDSFSAVNGRALSFEDIPPELMAGVDVYKDPAADIIEGGVGGTINLRTRMPFDAPGRVIAFSLDGSQGDMRGKTKPTGSLLLSDRWNTPIGEVGLLVDFADSRLASRQDTISVDPYFVRTDLVPGHTVFVPGGFGYRRLDLDRKRQGIAAALQWRPNDKLEGSFNFIQSAASLASAEHAVGFDPGSGDGPAAGTSFSYNDRGFFTNGTIANSPGGTGLGSSVLDSRYARRYSATSDYSAHLKYDANEHWSFSGDVQYIKAKSKTYDITAFNQLGADASPATLDITGSHPVVTMNNDPSYFHNPANYYLMAAMDYHDQNEAEEWAERLDGTYTFDGDGWLQSVRFGVRNTHRSATTRETSFRWNTVAPNWQAPSINNISALNGYEEVFPFEDYFRGDVRLPSTFIQPTTSLVKGYRDGAQIISSIAQLYGGGWTPFNDDYSSFTAGGGNGGVNYQKEKTLAGYAVLNFGHDVALFGQDMPLDGNIGVRVVQTKPQARGFQSFQVLTNTDPALFPANDLAFLNGATSPFVGGRDYVNVLPSLNLRLKIKPDLFLRFAAAKAIVRPDFTQMQPIFNISATGGVLSGGNCVQAGSGVQATCVYQYTATAGNPDLKPIRSTQFDVSLEWYFSKTGSFTFDVFHKDLYNFITSGLQSVPFTNNGVTRNVLVTQPYNAGHGTIGGFEVAYQQYYEFLPGLLRGLGLQANYTYVKSKGARNAAQDPFDRNQTTNATADDLPLEGLSKNSYNIAALYDLGPVSARLAYNWRQRYLLTPTAANINIPAWYDDYGQLDGSVFYSLNPHIKIGLEGVNLLKSESRVLVSYPGHPEEGLTKHNWVQTDRRYSLVLRGSF